jgi:hypothetical protein
MAQSRMHQQPEEYPLSVSTQSLPAQRGKQDNAGSPGHDHAWRAVEDLDQPLLLGMYRCDLCQVVWAL